MQDGTRILGQQLTVTAPGVDAIAHGRRVLFGAMIAATASACGNRGSGQIRKAGHKAASRRPGATARCRGTVTLM
ncbi:hypothetical protein ACVDG3_10135 [Meridianimarinicoccus sp. RP-17]|uniref:hypothetical protein n=1 Tax=Meridianimarinicoccus zhengii TaxID=2056810 RepID=UPI000DAD8181|nr:hypothetical protein [Phycocomes zhengii]